MLLQSQIDAHDTKSELLIAEIYKQDALQETEEQQLRW
jgi:hypothetical protein